MKLYYTTYENFRYSIKPYYVNGSVMNMNGVGLDLGFWLTFYTSNIKYSLSSPGTAFALLQGYTRT